MSTKTGQGRPTIAIIGAGLAGVSCALALRAAGLGPVIFEKSRGLGGRLAARRVTPPSGEETSFDHGAQYFTARSAAFASFTARAAKENAAAEWAPRGKTGAEPWMVGAPAMNALVKPAAAGLDIRLSTRIEKIERAGAGWRLTDAAGEVESFDMVVCTAPAEQTRALVIASNRLCAALSAVETAPCWAAMLAFEKPVPAPFDVRRSKTDAIAWLARNTSKPGRSGAADCWVAHAGPQWSRDRLELDAAAAAEELTARTRNIIGPGCPAPIHAVAHRWRYAMTTSPLGAPFAVDETDSLFAAGDWCLGARLEEAFSSGAAAGADIIRRLR